jgi:hypothetical protein
MADAVRRTFTIKRLVWVLHGSAKATSAPGIAADVGRYAKE